MYKAKNGCVTLPSGEMDYVRFGYGEKVLVLLPGVGDGLKTVRGMALPFALLYRKLARDFTVYVFSRRRNLPQTMSTREMAEDQNAAMEALGIEGAAVVGVSQGGMIAQWLAIDHPDKVGKLVLTVTAARPNPTIRECIELWTKQAGEDDYKGIMLSTAERSYSEKRLRAARLEYTLLGSIGKPKSYGRFLTEADSCLTHDCFSELGRINCPTLILGGREDKIVTPAASEEMAAAIPNSELYLYDGLGHGLYEEAPDFLARVAAFCR